MKNFTLGYMAKNVSPYNATVRNGYNPLAVVKGKSVEQVREKFAGRYGFSQSDEKFVVEEVKE